MSEDGNWTGNILLPTSCTTQSKMCINSLWISSPVSQTDHNTSICPIWRKLLLPSASSHYSEKEPSLGHLAELLEVSCLTKARARACQGWDAGTSYWQWGLTPVSCLGSIYFIGVAWKNTNLFAPWSNTLNLASVTYNLSPEFSSYLKNYDEEGGDGVSEFSKSRTPFPWSTVSLLPVVTSWRLWSCI